MFKRNNEGVHIINVAKTWEKLMVAARIIAAIPNPRDVLVSLAEFIKGHNARGKRKFLAFLFKVIAVASIVHRSHILFFLDEKFDSYRKLQLLIDRLQQRIRSESRPQVRHLHQGQLLGWQVDTRYSY